MKEKIKQFLQRFSFRTGVIVLAMCIPCYIISFAQFALDLSASLHTFFGLASSDWRKHSSMADSPSWA